LLKEAIYIYFYLVEVAGIEPASKAFVLQVIHKLRLIFLNNQNSQFFNTQNFDKSAYIVNALLGHLVKSNQGLSS